MNINDKNKQSNLNCECQNIFNHFNSLNIDNIRYMRENCKKTIKKCPEIQKKRILNNDCATESFRDYLIPEFMRYR